MKTLFSVVAILLISLQNSTAQYVDIPDINFRYGLFNKFKTCFNEQMQLDTTCSQVVNADSLNVQNITNIEGIQYFKNLKTLICENGQITTLPTLPENLISLSCFSNQLTSLPQLPKSLKKLNCEFNFFKNLPDLPSGLTSLNCNRNQLSTLPNLPSNLRYLTCFVNQLTYLPSLPDSLKELDCTSNLIETLPKLPNNLDYLNCSNNKNLRISEFNVNLGVLNCSQCNLKSLPKLPSSLRGLDCSYNILGSLPALPNHLVNIRCCNNQLTSIPRLPRALMYLSCENNQLTKLPAFLPDSQFVRLDCYNNPDLTCLPFLPKTMGEINLTSGTINCIPNRPILLQVFHTIDFYNKKNLEKFPICDLSYNPSNCPHIFPKIQGNVFIDANKNGFFDIGEVRKDGILATLSGSMSALSDSNGDYTLTSDSLGTFTLTITSPKHFNAIPSPQTFKLSVCDTIITQNIALQAIEDFDSLSIHISPITPFTRPGSSVIYKIDYQNLGTTTLNTQIGIRYEPNKLIIDSITSAFILNDSICTITGHTLFPGHSGELWVYGHVKTSAPLNSYLQLSATISSNIQQQTDKYRAIITGSFDPNDIQSTPTLTSKQVSDSEFIDYIIRFQNTGTDTAFNIIITDTLTDKLQTNSIELISSSHLCKTTVKNNIVSFEFPNILLVDSNTNELASHGMVRFRVRVKNNLKLNDEIINFASIYFDYNAPVITNKAITLIKDTPVMVIDILENQANDLYPNPSQGKIIVNVTEIEEMKIFSNIGQLVLHKTISGRQEIDLQTLKKGIYHYHLGHKKGILLLE